MGPIVLRSRFPYILISAAAILLLFAVLWVQRWTDACDAALKQTLRQYGEVQSLLSHYAVQQRDTSRKSRPESGNLFSLLNEKGTELGIARRIEGMRPVSRREGAAEQLDVRIRSLYLLECMKLIESLEQAESIVIESIHMQVTDKELLNVDMRISRRR